MLRLARLLVLAGVTLLALAGCGHKTKIPAGSIAFLGDSITAGYGLTPDQAYPALIHIDGMTMVNLGVSGSTTEDGLQRLRDYLGGGGDAPKLVVIALGANDILHGVDPAATQSNLNAAIRACQALGIPVYLCGIRIPMKFDTAPLFEKVAGDNHVPLMPDLLQGMQYHDDLMQEDHMHPTPDGQKLIADKLQAALLKAFAFR